MVSGGSELRGLARRSSVAGGDVKPAQAKPANPASGTPSEGLGFNAPAAASAKPLTAAHQTPLPLAALQCVTFYDKRNIAEFLTFTDAIALMLASTDMHRAIQAKPEFRLQQLLQALSRSFESMGCDDWLQQIRSLDAEILKRQAGGDQPFAPHSQAPGSSRLLRPDTHMTGALPHAASLGIIFADYCCKLMLARSATQTLQANERSRLAGLEALESERSRYAFELRAFERPMEDLVFHFAAERQNGPDPQGADQGVGAGQLAIDPQVMDRELIDAVGRGDVAWVRAGLREFLSLPPLLMPSARKLARLVLQPGGPLQFFGQHVCGYLRPLERRQYEAIMACVDEIFSAEIFSAAEQAKLRAKLAGIVRARSGNEQPAVVASLLDGISSLKFSSQRDELTLRSRLVMIFQLAGRGDPSALTPTVLDDFIDLKSFIPTRKATLQREVERILHRSMGGGNPELVASLVNELVNSKVFSPSREASLHGALSEVCERAMGSGDPELVASIRSEIASANLFSPPEEMNLMSKLADICRSAMSSDYKNPAVAASLLLGVSESSASPELKQTCLAAMGGSWHGGVAGFVDFVSDELLRYKRRAPEWVNDVVARLQVIKQALPDFN
jgi:hypothetical protein